MPHKNRTIFTLFALITLGLFELSFTVHTATSAKENLEKLASGLRELQKNIETEPASEELPPPPPELIIPKASLPKEITEQITILESLKNELTDKTLQPGGEYVSNNIKTFLAFIKEQNLSAPKDESLLNAIKDFAKKIPLLSAGTLRNFLVRYTFEVVGKDGLKKDSFNELSDALTPTIFDAAFIKQATKGYKTFVESFKAVALSLKLYKVPAKADVTSIIKQKPEKEEDIKRKKPGITGPRLLEKFKKEGHLVKIADTKKQKAATREELLNRIFYVEFLSRFGFENKAELVQILLKQIPRNGLTNEKIKKDINNLVSLALKQKIEELKALEVEIEEYIKDINKYSDKQEKLRLQAYKKEIEEKDLEEGVFTSTDKNKRLTYVDARNPENPKEANEFLLKPVKGVYEYKQRVEKSLPVEHKIFSIREATDLTINLINFLSFAKGVKRIYETSQQDFAKLIKGLITLEDDISKLEKGKGDEEILYNILTKAFYNLLSYIGPYQDIKSNYSFATKDMHFMAAGYGEPLSGFFANLSNPKAAIFLGEEGSLIEDKEPYQFIEAIRNSGFFS